MMNNVKCREDDRQIQLKILFVFGFLASTIAIRRQWFVVAQICYVVP